MHRGSKKFSGRKIIFKRTVRGVLKIFGPITFAYYIDVRREAALTLARLGSEGEGVVDALQATLMAVEGNAHTKGYATKALDWIGSPVALRALVDYLQVVRYA